MAQADLSDSAADLRSRKWLVVGSSSAIFASSYIGLNEAWYKEGDQERFHFFDDGPEWMQQDKAGHFWSSYQAGRWGYGMVNWTGAKEHRSAWAGGSMGLLYLTGIELLDARSSDWGFSWWDMLGNIVGAGTFIGQQLAWGEQRLQVKYSAHLTSFAELRPDVLGEGLAERLLKDYNGQTYWLSYPVNPPWQASHSDLHGLWCLSFGASATGMLGARDNQAFTEVLDPDQERYRRFFLSFDLDLTKIPTRSKFLRTTLYILNAVKVPMPALEVDGRGEVGFHPLYF